jgi:hypothetical protein
VSCLQDVISYSHWQWWCGRCTLEEVRATGITQDGEDEVLHLLLDGSAKEAIETCEKEDEGGDEDDEDAFEESHG